MKFSYLSPVNNGLKGDLAMIISMGESSRNLSDINYNIHNSTIISGVGSNGKSHIRYVTKLANLSSLTMYELRSLHGDGEAKYRAIGRWQILPSSMQMFKDWMGIDEGTVFSNHIQDLYPLFVILHKRPAVAAYLLDMRIRYSSIYASNSALKKRGTKLFEAGVGIPSASYAACCLAMEWSSKAMPDGRSFYDNGVDKAHVSFEACLKALETAKSRVINARSSGILDKASLVWIALGGSSGSIGAVDMDIQRNGEFHKYDGNRGRVVDIRDTVRVKGKISGATVDNETADVISDAHEKAGFRSKFVRKAQHKSIIKRHDAYVVDKKSVNGVNVFTYSDGTIVARGPVKVHSGFKLSKRSLNHLGGVHPKLVSVIKRAIEISGQDFGVTEGLRSLDRQKELFAKGNSKTMSSKHLKQGDGYSHAVDLVATSPVDWSSQKKYWMIADAVSIAAREQNVKVRWGGCWCDISIPSFSAFKAMESYVSSQRSKGKAPFLDLVHFEILL